VKAPDCSGFVKTVYFMNGVILARDASQQYLYGREVEPSTDSLEAGDLIFFGSTGKDGKKRITHVGLYIGDTEVIHSSGMVRINSLDPDRDNYSSYLKQTIQGARRYTGQESGKGYEFVARHKWYN
jgi:cell wall-associated NlpC family hydrolase